MALSVSDPLASVQRVNAGTGSERVVAVIALERVALHVQLVERGGDYVVSKSAFHRVVTESAGEMSLADPAFKRVVSRQPVEHVGSVEPVDGVVGAAPLQTVAHRAPNDRLTLARGGTERGRLDVVSKPVDGYRRGAGRPGIQVWPGRDVEVATDQRIVLGEAPGAL